MEEEFVEYPSEGRRRYMCLRCGKTFSKEEMELTPGIHCPYCGYRIVMKVRSYQPKRIRAI